MHDAGGRIVYQRSGALDLTASEAYGPGRIRFSLDLPALPAGWYDAALVMSSGTQYLDSQSLALIQLADDAPLTRPDGRFGFIATKLPFAGWQELPNVLPLLSAGRVKLALWGPTGEIGQMDSGAFDTLLERLQDSTLPRPHACLICLPCWARRWTPTLLPDLQTRPIR